MFLSVKERARQIALGQFTAPPTTSAPVASLIDLAPEAQPAVAPPRKTGGKDATQTAAADSKKKSSKKAPTKEATPKVAPPQKAPPKTTPPKATPPPPSKPTSSKTTASPPEAPSPKKSSSKSKLSKEPPTTETPPPKKSSRSKTPKEPPSPKLSSYKSPWTSSSKPPSSPKPPSQKSKSSSTKSKRAKSPPKRVDSPLASESDSDDDPLSALKSACLKQITAVPGLGQRRLAIMLKQRSSGEWYAALKDTGADKYLKSWMNREKTYKTRNEALEAYLVFAMKMRERSGTGLGWFPMSPRAGSPKGKGR